MSTTIYIVRHGETFMNRFNRMQGWIDADLTTKGRQQAVQTGQELHAVHFDSLYSSDLNRAVNTRDLIAQQFDHPVARVVADRVFREVFFGYFEGLDSDETWRQVGASKHLTTQTAIMQEYDFRTSRQLMHELDPEHLAETYDQVIHRWQRGIQTIYRQNQPNSRVLLVTHGTFIRTLADFKGINTLDNYPKNGSVSKIVVTDAGFDFSQYNGEPL
ncbi:histidine phosphatase family protein [Levilactobacillus zymae]|uniref:histidine phosphatase family protein n=1 Tax=Levilactobacillus zymae TaxID=267363 RepID=UPI0028BAB721|nr:histidine phosphatase family protein [Levilactobacillus zymae]MDT6981565.1 histidine phosphatase family protein [Levilactobacillus zymae]